MEKKDTFSKAKKMWDEERNKKEINKTFAEVTSKDKFQAFWICPLNGCRVVKSPSQIYGCLYRGTPICPCGKNIPAQKMIKFKAPEKVNTYWHFERNNAFNVFPESTYANSNQYVYVKCDKHNWGIYEEKKQRCADLIDHIPCPMCSGTMASPENNLQINFPHIAKELHPAFPAQLISPNSHQTYPWWCHLCQDYYKKEVALRTSQNQGCPLHNAAHHSSKTQEMLCLTFNDILGNFSNCTFEDLKWSSGHSVTIDIYNPIFKIAIEYDSYHHDSEERARSDQEKM